MPGDSTPGIWQTDNLVIALAHVAYCRWRNGGNNIKCDNAPRASATHLLIFLYTNLSLTIDDLGEADNFVRALNMYWETR